MFDVACLGPIACCNTFAISSAIPCAFSNVEKLRRVFYVLVYVDVVVVCSFVGFVASCSCSAFFVLLVLGGVFRFAFGIAN